ncbi:unnamed protein product [Prunus armeniaca]|uniref:Uncharacterized protein n=1 Tax=Prunus armeniaca TaxID=36596 RepID=A0A6J5UQP8_PRUAR|nr:unnamed protein product [Prunus armeniaca]
MPRSFPAFGTRHKKQSKVPMMKLQPPRRKPKKRLKTILNEHMDIEQLKVLVHQTLEPRCWSHRPDPYLLNLQLLPGCTRLENE